MQFQVKQVGTSKSYCMTVLLLVNFFFCLFILVIIYTASIWISVIGLDITLAPF